MGSATLSAAAAAAFLKGKVGGRFCGFGNPIHVSVTNNYSSKKKLGNSSFCLSSRKFEKSVSSLSEEAEAESEIKKGADVLDIRVGRIVKAWIHEEADSLYVEEVDVGEVESRIICSGLVKYIPLHHLEGLPVVVLANLKARNMRGVKSNGMLMAASDASHTKVELLMPPADSLPGHRIWFGSPLHYLNHPPPASPNQIQKKKIWELVQPHLKTDDSCVAMLKDLDHVMRTSSGVVRCSSLKNANIS